MPKAAKRLAEMQPPKRVKNDSFRVMNDLKERHRAPTRIASNDWGQAIGGPNGEPQRTNEFPVRINKPNRERDSRLRLKQEYTRQRGAANGVDLGVANLNDADLQAFEDIDRQKQVVNFESWLASYLNMSDPATAKLVDEIMPEYWEKRQEAIENQAELQKNLALIRLRGPQSKMDFMILYMLSTGQIQIPRGSVFQPDTWSYDNTNFARGMFNPRRYMPNIVPMTADQKKDPIGTISALANALGGFGAEIPAGQAIQLAGRGNPLAIGGLNDNSFANAARVVRV